MLGHVEAASAVATWSYDNVADLDDKLGGVGLRAFDLDRVPKDPNPGHSMWRPLWYCRMTFDLPLTLWAPRYVAHMIGLFLEGVAKNIVGPRVRDVYRLPLGSLLRRLEPVLDAPTHRDLAEFVPYYNMAKHHVEERESVFSAADSLTLYFIGRALGNRLVPLIPAPVPAGS